VDIKTERHLVTAGSELSFPVRFGHESVTKDLADPQEVLIAVSAGDKRDTDRHFMATSECGHIEDRRMEALHQLSKKRNTD
jgi:hypothetical protein